MRPTLDIEAGIGAHARLVASLATLTDEDVGRPSLLPDWTVGHVLSHLARNADSHTWLLEGAVVDEVRVQYPEAGMRTRDIEAGATRTAREVTEDLVAACGRLERAWLQLPDDLWESLGIVTPGPETMAEILFRRLRETEVHHVDLGLGYRAEDWSDRYVEGELARRLDRLPDRADRRALVTWLLNRGPAPSLSPW